MSDTQFYQIGCPIPAPRSDNRHIALRHPLWGIVCMLGVTTTCLYGKGLILLVVEMTLQPIFWIMRWGVRLGWEKMEEREESERIVAKTEYVPMRQDLFKIVVAISDTGTCFHKELVTSFLEKTLFWKLVLQQSLLSLVCN